MIHILISGLGSAYLNHFKLPHLGHCTAVEEKPDNLSGHMVIPSWVRNISDSNQASALDVKAVVGRLIGVFVMDFICQFPSNRQRRYELGILII